MESAGEPIALVTLASLKSSVLTRTACVFLMQERGSSLLKAVFRTFSMLFPTPETAANPAPLSAPGLGHAETGQGCNLSGSHALGQNSHFHRHQHGHAAAPNV